MKSKMSLSKMLFNPFERYAGGTALIAGVGIAMVAALLASLFYTRFDGVLDVHTVFEKVTLTTALIDQAVNAISLFVVLYLLALVSGARGIRAIDVLGTLMLARAPLVFVPLLNITHTLSRSAEQMMHSMTENPLVPDLSALLPAIPLIIVMSLLVVWTVALYFNAYKVSTHLKGARLVLSFIAGLLLAEILSKIILSLL